MTEVEADKWPRGPRRLIRPALFALLAMMTLGLLGVVYVNGHWPRRILTVVNESGKPVDNVEVLLGSGPEHYGLGRLHVHEAKSVRVFPGDEDFMTLQFLNGKRAVMWQGQYEEGTIGYHPRVIIGKNDAVRGETGLYSP